MFTTELKQAAKFYHLVQETTQRTEELQDSHINVERLKGKKKLSLHLVMAAEICNEEVFLCVCFLGFAKEFHIVHLFPP